MGLRGGGRWMLKPKTPMTMVQKIYSEKKSSYLPNAE
jgi:hypothetical protein